MLRGKTARMSKLMISNSFPLPVNLCKRFPVFWQYYMSFSEQKAYTKGFEFQKLILSDTYSIKNTLLFSGFPEKNRAFSHFVKALTQSISLFHKSFSMFPYFEVIVYNVLRLSSLGSSNMQIRFAK